MDFSKVFHACPLIYILLLTLSVSSLAIWIYSLITLRLNLLMPLTFMHELKKMIVDKKFDAALVKCRQDKYFVAHIVTAGLSARHHGPQVMLELMRTEAKRSSNQLWQRIALLNDIATIAPMLGLMGTVWGLFFAFYDPHVSSESLMTLFDGLGIAVGTTVAGLAVAILAMIFYISMKYRLFKIMSQIENESLLLVSVVKF